MECRRRITYISELNKNNEKKKTKRFLDISIIKYSGFHINLSIDMQAIETK